MSAAVILAAGASTRLGEPKQLLKLNGETLLERAVRVAQEAGLAPRIVVVHDAGWIDSLQARGAEVLLNPRYNEGISTSIHAGVRWAQGRSAPGVVLMTCDQPSVTPGHLQALTASGAITASAYAGRRGVPAYFPATSFPELLQLTGDTGARRLLRDAATIDLPHGEIDIDTAKDLTQARRLFG